MGVIVETWGIITSFQTKSSPNESRQTYSKCSPALWIHEKLDEKLKILGARLTLKLPL